MDVFKTKYADPEAILPRAVLCLSYDKEKSMEYYTNTRTELEKMKISTVKIFADGVLESKTACLHEPYVGTDSRGLPNFTPQQLKAVCQRFDKAGFQIHVMFIPTIQFH